MDGNVDGLDSYVFNEIICSDDSDGGEGGTSGGGSMPSLGISPVCWWIIWVTVLLSLYMLVESGFDAADTMASLGFIVFLIARWLGS